jgi:hypothetical protein
VKRTLHIALLVIGIALSINAQPQATWLERTHNFGVFQEGDGKVTCHMQVVNTGNEPVLIVKTQAGCGCTSIKHPEAPIQPGDTAAVSITYNPSGRPGQFTKQAIIFTNTTPNRTILEISGNVIPTSATLDKQYPLSAGSLRISKRDIPFGEIVKGKGCTRYLSAYNASTDTLLVSVRGAKPHLHASIVPDTVPPGRVTALTVHYTSNYAPLWGLNVDTLFVESRPLNSTTNAENASAEVYVMAQVMENFDHLTDQQRASAPVIVVDCGESLDFGTINRGDVVTRTFTVTNKGKNVLTLRRLWVPQGEGITIKTSRQEIKHGKKATITVTVDSSQQIEEMLNVPLTLLCNDPDSSRVVIRLVGIIDKK